MAPSASSPRSFVTAFRTVTFMLWDTLRDTQVATVPIKRKVRKIGNSLMVAIPTQVAALAGIEAGDTVEFDYLGRGELRIEKV